MADELTGLYVLVGTAVVGQAGAAIVGFVKWLGTRAVEREDKDKEDAEAKLGKLEQRFDELRIALDTRLEKQAEFYRGQLREHQAAAEKRLEDLEIRMRHDMTRAVADSLRRKR